MRAGWLALVATTGCAMTGGTRWSSSGGSSSSAPSTSASPTNARTGLEPEAVPEEAPRSDATTAAALGGLPGAPCKADREEMARSAGLTGPCWDPPGIAKAFPLLPLVRGMRTYEDPDPTMMVMHAVYLFDMPRGVKVTEGYVQMQAHDGAWWGYEPYGTGGFAKPVLPDLAGKPITDALALLDTMDTPFVIDVTWDANCDGPHETVCGADTEVRGGGLIEMRIAQRIQHPGTNDERRVIPGGLEGRPPADVIAELTGVGFTNIVVVEKDLPCERGIVCAAPRPGWHPTNQVIELEVRRAKR